MKKVFLKISQNSQENTCAQVFFLIKLQASPFLLNTSGRLLLEAVVQGYFKNQELSSEVIILGTSDKNRN